MNVFNSIYSTDIDDFERSYIIAETAFNIEIERANKEYMLESGLICLGEDTTFLETAKTNKGNAFSKFVKSICDGIRNFFTSIGETISNMFDKRKDLTLDEVTKSSKITLSRDITKLDSVAEREIQKGNRLLEQVSSSTGGISDSLIGEWIKSSGTKIMEVAPKAITIGTALGFNTIIASIFKKNKNRLKQTEDAAKSSDDGDPKKQQQKRSIMNHISKLFHVIIDESKTVSGEIDKSVMGQYRKSVKDADKDADTEKQKAAVTLENLRKMYMDGKVAEDVYLKRVKEFETRYGTIDEQASTKKAKSRSKAIEQSSALREYNKRYDEITRMIKRKEIEPAIGRAYLTYIEKQQKLYNDGKLEFSDYMINLKMNTIKSKA